MATQSIPQPENPESASPPHCAHPWPFEYCYQGPRTHNAEHAARLLLASTAATVLTNLLFNDAAMANDRSNSQYTDNPPQPFTQATAHGLFCALRVCLADIQDVAGYFEELHLSPLEDEGGEA